MRVLVTGASGMLGQYILDVFRNAGHVCVGTDRTDLDITDASAVVRVIDAVSSDVVINTAAYNFVDKVEELDVYPIAHAVNAIGPVNLARACKAREIPFVHYGTDYVFDGMKTEGYVESDAPNPLSKYGETKSAGEQGVLAEGGKSYVVRTTKIFGKPGVGENSKISFVALMQKLAAEKSELKIVDEEYGRPTYAKDIAEATLALVTGDGKPGAYHFVNEGAGVTPFGFAEEIFGILGVTTPCIPVPASTFARAAKIPKHGVLLNTKFPPLRPRIDALRDFLLR